MRSITDRECVEWLESNDIDAISNRGFTELTGDYEVFFAAPKDARAQQNLARELVDWVGPFDVALLRVTDWPAFKPEEMAILLRLRLGHAEDRRLIDAPGHIFTCGERDELVGWVALMMGFGWDGFLFTSPFHGDMFQTSHEDFIWMTTSCSESLASAKRLPRAHGLEIYRETEIGE